jgi:hypothetical protein
MPYLTEEQRQLAGTITDGILGMTGLRHKKLGIKSGKKIDLFAVCMKE